MINGNPIDPNEMNESLPLSVSEFLRIPKLNEDKDG